jgi:S1-C subfamily serine protease
MTEHPDYHGDETTPAGEAWSVPPAPASTPAGPEDTTGAGVAPTGQGEEYRDFSRPDSPLGQPSPYGHPTDPYGGQRSPYGAQPSPYGTSPYAGQPPYYGAGGYFGGRPSPPTGALTAPPPSPADRPSRKARRSAWLPIALIAAFIGALVGGGIGAAVARNTGSSKPAAIVREVVPPNTQIAKPQSVPAILAKVEPGVVSVTTNLGAGTGMILTAAGQVLTNYHVVSGASSIKVTVFNETSPRPATLKGFDKSNDVALLQISGASGLPVVTLGDSDTLQVGDDVIAVGNALNLAGGPTVTEGIVSAKGRSVDPAAPQNLIQTDAAINPGNSGGPLVNANGQVVGMNTLVIQQASSSEAAQNLGFAIPVNTIKPLVPDLAKGVQRTPAYLGVGVVTLTPDIAQRLAITATQGAIIQDLPAVGPAAKAGLQQSDVITSFDGQPVTSDTALVQLIHNHKPGDSVKIGYTRGNSSATVTVTLGAAPNS